MAVVTSLVLSSTAAAQTRRQWFGLDIEALGARTVDPSNGDLFLLGGGGALGAELNLHPLLGLHAAGAVLAFAPDQSTSSALWFAGRAGLRFHVLGLAGSGHDLWVDAHGVIASSGAVTRPGFDAGLAFAWRVARGVRVGPMVRYVWSSDPEFTDPQVLCVGIHVGLFGDPRADVAASLPEGTPDADRDGVADPDDLCPTEPVGASPDPARRGCPLRDRDGDGVPDARDQCPDLAAGEHPNPARAGCPLPDTDADGVFDGDDACPVTPAGARPSPARPGCPSGDQDSDGVYDDEDVCPTVPAGAQPDPSRRGCPLADRDRDTVMDPVDRCPDEPGAPSVDPARNGCPGLVRVENNQIRTLQPVYFATNRDVILEASFPVLLAVADAMRALHVARLRVEGHTDARGNRRRNVVLSQRRAESVRRWLVEHGFPDAALTAVGHGPDRAVESNRTALGRAANRRVEFHIEATDN